MADVPKTTTIVIAQAVRVALAAAPFEVIQGLAGLIVAPRDTTAVMRLAIRISETLVILGFRIRATSESHHVVMTGLLFADRSTYDLTSKDPILREVAEAAISRAIVQAIESAEGRIVRSYKPPDRLSEPQKITLARAKIEECTVVTFYCCAAPGLHGCNHSGEMPIGEAIARWGGGRRLDQLPMICSLCGSRKIMVRANREARTDIAGKRNF